MRSGSSIAAAAVAVWLVPGSAPPHVYRDALGDAEAGHGDIASVTVSDRAGRATVTMDIRGLRASDSVIFELKRRPLATSQYVLSFSRSGAWELDSVMPPGQTMRDVTRLPGNAFSRMGGTYVLRLGPGILAGPILRGAKSFFFELHVDTSKWADVADWAPNSDYVTPRGWWKYDLTSVR